MHRRQAAAAALAFALTITAGLASATESVASKSAGADRCAPVPRDQFRSEPDLKAAVEGFGYQVVRVGTDSGCYSVLAADRRGKLFDIKFEGANLRMVSRYAARQEPEIVAQR
jgi:hypothetical protein